MIVWAHAHTASRYLGESASEWIGRASDFLPESFEFSRVCLNFLECSHSFSNDASGACAQHMGFLLRWRAVGSGGLVISFPYLLECSRFSLIFLECSKSFSNYLLGACTHRTVVPLKVASGRIGRAGDSPLECSRMSSTIFEYSETIFRLRVCLTHVFCVFAADGYGSGGDKDEEHKLLITRTA